MQEEAIITNPNRIFNRTTRHPGKDWQGPIQIAHCAHVMPAPHYSHPDSTLLTIGAHLVRNGLHIE